MPLLRFRTGDVAVLHEDPCPCGRTSPRLGPILGRKCQLLKYRGTSVYPPAIFGVLQEIPGIRNFYIEVHDQFDLSDHIRVVVGTEVRELSAMFIAERIAAKVRVKPEVVLSEPKDVAAKVLQENKRKPITFFDYRRRKHE
jgi:phenylacetate-CoA ligase